VGSFCNACVLTAAFSCRVSSYDSKKYSPDATFDAPEYTEIFLRKFHQYLSA